MNADRPGEEPEAPAQMNPIEEALHNLRALTSCRCEEAWTARKRHAPECRWDHAEDVEILATRIVALEGALAAQYHALSRLLEGVGLPVTLKRVGTGD